MTRKDHQLIARVIEGYNERLREFESTKPEELAVVRELAQSLGRAFDARFERFDYDRFMKACNV
jgi:hypothetical protein